jgi:hypothetical protein
LNLLSEIKLIDQRVDHSLFAIATHRFSVSEVKKRDDKDQNHEDGRNERDAAKPSEHELAVAGAGRRL